MAGAVSRWLGSIDDLSKIVQRLQRVQIENCPAIEAIKRYDSEETLFYCDPPYPHDSRGDSNAYAFEMTDLEHRKLAHVLRHIKGKVAISGYDCSLMEELYGDWKRIPAPAKSCHSVKKLRTEVLWVNYEPDIQLIKKTQSKQSNKLNKYSMKLPGEILSSSFEQAARLINTGEQVMLSWDVIEKISYICRLPSNKSGIRFILACSLAKLDDPTLDIRKPFSKEIKENDS